MACRKCGSDWKTLRGRDCSRCPHCDKVQRCVERKRGRWVDQESTKPCKQCGKVFTSKVFSGPAFTQSYCSAECRCRGRSEWRREWYVAYRQGLRKQKQRRKHAHRPTCRECGQQFKRQQGSNSSNIYCSKACFFAARASGKQTWDRTNSKKAYWHVEGPYAGAPSAKLMALVSKAHAAIEWAGDALGRLAHKELARPTCQECGCPCNDGATRFCSYKCNKAWRGVRQCRCGTDVKNAAAFGPSPLCAACKRESLREWRRIARDTRKRVRRGGGHWNPEVKSLAVFKRDKWVCYLCKQKCHKVYDSHDPLSATVDHVYPVARGGDHDWHNVRTACALCNSKKGDSIKGQRLLRFG